MLPFDQKPWAKPVAATVIVITLIAAVCVPIILHRRQTLDLPMVVTIILLLFAIIPPNIAVLRRRRPGNPDAAAQPSNLYPTRPTSH